MAAITSNRKNKHFVLDQVRLKRAQQALGTRTETETVERALENAITEAERNKQAWAAHDKFLRSAIKSGAQIVDVYGRRRKTSSWAYFLTAPSILLLSELAMPPSFPKDESI